VRRRIIAIVVAVLAVPASVLVAGEVLGHSAHKLVGQPPSDLHAASVELHSAAGQTVSGWMVRGTPGAGAVLLLHGVRADRRDMVGRAQFLKRLGYSVLLIDLPAHGESAGEHITYGQAESHGVTAALDYLAREFPSERIGVIGVSLGAASLVLSKPSVPLSAVVLESMFPTIRDAISDRLSIYLGPLGEPLTSLLLWQLSLRLDISPDQLRPIAELPSLRAPLLIAGGSVDRRTTLAETRRIYAAAPEPKELWVVDGAAHVDLHAFDSTAYEERVSTFLAKYLRVAG
jgi:pimeloyl-ACP methyl ester carboxylesterase